MAISRLEWAATRQAASDYTRFAKEIEHIEQGINLFKQGLKDLTTISPNPQRVQARLRREATRLTGAPIPPSLALERAMGRPDFQDACVLQRIVACSRCVGRIILAGGEYGTGWLVGDGLLITNHHVLPNREVAATAYVTMGYERTEDSQPQAGETFRLRPDQFFLTPTETGFDESYDGLDFTVVAVEPRSDTGKELAVYRHVRLDGGLGKIIEGENCLVIQHPGGDFKKVVLRDIRLLMVTDAPGADQHVFYESDTLPGSSGGMVIALGTGEIFALHNASVPRRDAQGNYLKKDGTVYQAGESDELIDWIANQGVRVSKIMEALRTLPVPAAMEEKRQRLLQGLIRPAPTLVEQPSDKLLNTKPDDFPEPLPAGGLFAPQPAAGPGTRYVLKLTTGVVARDYALQTLQRRFPGGTVVPLVPGDDRSALSSFVLFDLPASSDPWVTAAQLESIDGVEEAEPDLPQRTTEGGPEFAPIASPQLTESGLFELWEDGRSEWDEPRFLRQWRDSAHVRKLNPSVAKDLAAIRQWTRRATGFDRLTTRHLDAAALAALADLRIAQFDTGYTNHTKLWGGYDLTADYDLVANDDDAHDELQGGFMKAPGHGTRTASVLVGNPAAQSLNGHDGNLGLLRGLPKAADKPAVLLTPFRIAKSVILVDRISELVRGVHRAVDAGFPVLTMSMGTLGNRVLAEVARYAYDRGSIWCCAAGNQVKFVVAPGKYPGVICVAASNPDDGPWSGSCRGLEVDITAPGEDVYVPILNDDNEEDMAYGSGTSYATPHVAAAALLWLARHQTALNYPEPWQRVEAFRYCLARSARPVPQLRPDKFGPGILQVDKLLEVALPTADQLRYAYPDGRGQERGPSDRQPLAMRELVYKDWQQVLAATTRPGIAAAVGHERMGAALALSEPAQEFARTLAAHTSLPQQVVIQESTGGYPPAIGAYARLRVLQQLQARAKPAY
ncbi:peptidase S8 and S53 subtilisin kexin sedolisin [Hymenobacter roseosalivarius DSM 11622]|uniref:Serine protease n=1 Tax=Hymenobacter roseosalivarius DSM 11622 TaxID=645990 RepID=A0A1W1VJC8_9BACT|nr:S8 family serine peptidase [Hymenobacter roseosalivarius]SMB93383.1 peptidase S8 and S53 subtilisin kexin sedolisin [Hymenobacter roseosalivarius DSM 11622]